MLVLVEPSVAARCSKPTPTVGERTPHEVGASVENFRLRVEPLLPGHGHELLRNGRGGELWVALDRHGDPVRTEAHGLCRDNGIVQEPAIRSRLKIDALDRAERRLEGRLSAEHAREQPRANVVLEHKATTAGVLRRRDLTRQGVPEFLRTRRFVGKV